LRLKENGRQLRYYDPRKFGRFYLVENTADVIGHLGPEPLSRQFTAAALGLRLAARNRHLKPLLLDQGFLAGLGNIYADEALWHAGLHPLTRSSALNEKQVRRLHRAIRRVLRKGLANFGTTLGRGAANYYSLERGAGGNEEKLKVFRRQGLPCPRCRTTIQRLVVAQRGTHICPACQICGDTR
jgi:formamidopyrimidine-DNA glycosylase